jgi:hypothetical protein
VGSDGFPILNDHKKRALFIQSNVKNFGTVPASGELDEKWFLDGKEIQPQGSVPRKSVLIFPGQSVHENIEFGLSTYDAIAHGKIIVSVRIIAKYKGASDRTYDYCEDERYAPESGGFAAQGSCGP